jgi:tetratricopeptide (TPR) repeat protein
MELHHQSVSAENVAATPPGTNLSARGEHSMPLSVRSSRREIALAVGLIALATVVAYANSFFAPFVFDGEVRIEQNPAIRQFWPPWAPMIGTTRPVAVWSFAMNYAMDGLHTWGYHVVNLAIHLAAALVLFGIVRRTLSRGQLAARFGGAAWGLALAVALLWLVHPLQTQSVTYIYQRYESLMGLFLLLTLYGFIRAQDASHPNQWYVVSVACCLLAVATKEVAAVAPLLVLWYDRALVASSWREIVRRRWAYYVGLAGTWPILAALMLSQAHKFAEAGVLVVKNVTPWQYALSQPGVIAHYLRLCFWPTDLCIDYGWPVADTAVAIVPPLVLIVALLALTAWAIFRWPAWSFLGAWFFLILAPTSSVFPIRDLALEHRMYLPLAAVVAAVVVGVWSAGRWLLRRGTIPLRALPLVGCTLTVYACLALGTLTLHRNLVYQSTVSVWEDTVAKAPSNPRAHYDLGVALANCGRTEEAIAEYQKALEISPDHAKAHYSLGLALAARQRFGEAIIHYRQAVAVKPDFADAYYNLGIALAKCGRTEEAIAEYETALEISPDYADAHYNLGLALAGRKRFDEAIVHYRRAVTVKPDFAAAHCGLGIALAALGRLDDAIAEYQEAIKHKPDFAETHNNLANALLRCGRTDEAIVHFNRALEIKPDFAAARKNLAAALGQQGKAD